MPFDPPSGRGWAMGDRPEGLGTCLGDCLGCLVMSILFGLFVIWFAHKVGPW